MRKNVVKFFGFFVFVYFCLVMRVFASGEYVIFLDTNNIRSGPSTGYRSLTVTPF